MCRQGHAGRAPVGGGGGGVTRPERAPLEGGRGPLRCPRAALAAIGEGREDDLVL